MVDDFYRHQLTEILEFKDPDHLMHTRPLAALRGLLPVAASPEVIEEGLRHRTLKFECSPLARHQWWRCAIRRGGGERGPGHCLHRAASASSCCCRCWSLVLPRISGRHGICP